MCIIHLSVSIKEEYRIYVSWRSLLLLAKLRASNPITSQMCYLHFWVEEGSSKLDLYMQQAYVTKLHGFLIILGSDKKYFSNHWKWIKYLILDSHSPNIPCAS